MKKLIALMLILLVINSMILGMNIFADNGTEIIEISGNHAVSVNYIFSKLGANVSTKGNMYMITKDNNTIILCVGSKYAIVNKEWVVMNIPVTSLVKTNTVVVSMKFIEKYDTLFGNEIVWNAKSHTLNVVKAPENSKISFGMVTDFAGLGDQSFNDWGWSGLKKAGKELGAEPLVIQSYTQEDFLINMLNMAREVDLTVGIGFLLEDAMTFAADIFPEKKFGIVDTVIDRPNVMSITYKENEGSFLVGVIAGMTTETNTVGFIGGMQIPIIKEFEAGFRAGVASVNPNAKVLINYTGAFDNPDLGRETALSQYAQKADVIYHASGACWLGIVGAADENGFWAIGVDSDQSGFSKKNRVLCSMVKNVDTATYFLTKSLAAGTFKGGYEKCLGLLEGGVGYSDNGKNVSAKAAEIAEKYKTEIVKGKIIVPSTDEELKAFKPVKLR